MKRATLLLLAAALIAPGMVQAAVCPATPAQPLRPLGIAPVANEFELGANQPGLASGVLSQAYDEAGSVDQVLLRMRLQACQNAAMATPAPGLVNPDDPAAYKPKTQFDNTPWRFNMSQNGKNMTADEFSAWMKSRGVRVARGAGPIPAAAAPDGTQPQAPATDAQAAPATPAQAPAQTPPQPE